MKDAEYNNGREPDTLYDLLHAAQPVYEALPLHAEIPYQNLTKSRSNMGPHKLSRSGSGLEYLEARPYRGEGIDRREPNAKLSARMGKPIALDMKTEIRQQVYIWCDLSPSTNYASRPDLPTVRQAELIMALALAKKLAWNQEMLGVLGGKGQFQGGKAEERIGQQLLDDLVETEGGMPVVHKQANPDSTAVLFSDFLVANTEDVAAGLDHLNARGMTGFLVMVLDPEYVDFNFEGNRKFMGLEGEGSITFPNSKSIQKQFKTLMAEHIAELEKIADERGFKLILQRTDEPLVQALETIYEIEGEPVKPVFRPDVAKP